jgi:peptide/nickel transport system permease protein
LPPKGFPIVQRFIDAIQSIPGLILALVMVVVLGPSTTTAITAIAIVNIPAQARVVRRAVLSVAKDTYREILDPKLRNGSA